MLALTSTGLLGGAQRAELPFRASLTRRKQLVGKRLVFEIHLGLDGEAAVIDSIHEHVGPVVTPALDGPGAALQSDRELVITNDVHEVLTWRAWQDGGLSLPRTSGDQYDSYPKVSLSDLQPGDLVFTTDPTQHVGIYVGNGMMVHATHTGDFVREVSISAPGEHITLAVRPG